MIEIVAATRLPDAQFWAKAALGQSLLRLKNDSRIVSHIAFENKLGLPHVYNDRIVSRDSSTILVFMHDDVWIDDYCFADRVIDGLQRYQIIGVAGNRRRAKHQPSWCFASPRLSWDEKSNLSGAVAHGEYPFAEVSFFGKMPADCELLDGVLLGARKSTLVFSGLIFDARFDFHFYDMDFCRTARAKGLRLGTWPICVTHQSGGAFGSPIWFEGYRAYLQKWGN